MRILSLRAIAVLRIRRPYRDGCFLNILFVRGDGFNALRKIELLQYVEANRAGVSRSDAVRAEKRNRSGGAPFRRRFIRAAAPFSWRRDAP
jgi:hypothetical protein